MMPRVMDADRELASWFGRCTASLSMEAVSIILAQRVIARWSTSPPEADKPRRFAAAPFGRGTWGRRVVWSCQDMFFSGDFCPPCLQRGIWGRRAVQSWRGVCSPGVFCPPQLQRGSNNGPVFITTHKNAPYIGRSFCGQSRNRLRPASRRTGPLMRLPRACLLPRPDNSRVLCYNSIYWTRGHGYVSGLLGCKHQG
jgi:hypothetical protein